MLDHPKQDNAGVEKFDCQQDKIDLKSENRPSIAPVSDQKLLPKTLLSKLEKYLEV